MTKSSPEAGAPSPPSTSAPTEASLLRAQVSAVEALLAGLRQENDKLHAALAVERAARDSDELTRLRQDVHLVNYRLSRALRVFDALGLEPPDPKAPVDSFVDDDFLQRLPERVAASLAKRAAAPTLPGDEPDMGEAERPQDTPPQNVSPQKGAGDSEPPPETVKPVEPVAQTGDKSPPVTGESNVQTPPEPAPQPSVDIPPVEKLPILVNESNPAANCLRMLIGADAIWLYRDPTRIKIDMTNPEKKRSVSFWLEWKKDVIEYTRESVEVEEDSCPNFLREYSIEFDIGQGPNFLVLVMGAMFDFRIEPKREPALHEDEPPQDETMREDDPVLVDS